LVKWVRWVLLCAAVVLGALLAGVAGGDQGKPETKAEDAARELMEQGQALFKDGRYQAAMEKFEAAYKTHPYGAFLYNAAFAAEKAGDLQRAIARYNEYLASDPSSPYAEQVREKIKKLEQQLSKPPEPTAPDAGAPADAGPPPDGGAAVPEGGAPVPADEASIQEIRSLVFVQTEPAGAPFAVWERLVATAEPFKFGADNAGWKQIVTEARTPTDLSLKVGYYHVVIDKFRDYNRSETDISLAPGHVYTFKASLSQGQFLGTLFLRTNVERAKVFVDDPPPHKGAPVFRGTDTRELNSGEHEIWVESPGYVTGHKSFTIEQAKTTELDVQLERVDYGYVLVEGNAGEVEIEVNEQPQGVYSSQGDPVRLKLPAGKHKLVLDASGRKALETEIDVPQGQVLPIQATLVESYPRAQAVVLGVLSVGAIIGGVFLHLEYAKGPESEGGPHSDDIRTVFNVTRFVAFGAGALFAGLSIFYAVYDPYPDSFLKNTKVRDMNEQEAREESGEPAKPEKKQSAIPFVAPWASEVGGGLDVGFAF
jgi:tetratricopeptide repeat protein/PEGA domain-containing protein